MQTVKEKKWQMKEGAEELVQRLAADARIPALLARLLVVRGISDPDGVKSFLAPKLTGLSDPMLLKGMPEAVERLVAARANNETVCIHGDYDVDGMTAVALLVSFLSAVGIKAEYVIPLRLEEGYGLSADGVDAAVALGARVLVTVDCGITSVNEAAYCREKGIGLIITDHHTPGPELPDALAVINPLQPGCNSSYRELAGVGLAFKLAIALRSRLRSEGAFEGGVEPNLREYLDLVALGTIADLVPLTGENRILTAHGLQELTNTGRVGIRELKGVSAVTGQVSASDVGFRLAPRLNATGRLDDARRGVDLLLAKEREPASCAAAELDAANRERQEIEREILKDVLSTVRNEPGMAGRRSIVVASEKWHPGVIGIVASRVVEAYHRPVILISLQDGVGKGSGRSIPGLHLHDALLACGEHLQKFGGHRQAAGLTVSEDTLEAFVKSFDEVVAGRLTEEDLTPVLHIDALLTPEQVTRELLELTAAMRPFGMGNPEPVFMLQGVEVQQARVLKESHLKAKLSAGGIVFDAIGFGMASGAVAGDIVDIAFAVELNVWNGRESLQLRLKDIRISGGEVGAS